jgi:hypothetical protein
MCFGKSVLSTFPLITLVGNYLQGIVPLFFVLLATTIFIEESLKIDIALWLIIIDSERGVFAFKHK